MDKATAEARTRPAPRPKKATVAAEPRAGGGGYLDGIDLPSSSDSEGSEGEQDGRRRPLLGEDDEARPVLRHMVTARDARKQGDKERKLLEKAAQVG